MSAKQKSRKTRNIVFFCPRGTVIWSNSSMGKSILKPWKILTVQRNPNSYTGKPVRQEIWCGSFIFQIAPFLARCCAQRSVVSRWDRFQFNFFFRSNVWSIYHFSIPETVGMVKGLRKRIMIPSMMYATIVFFFCVCSYSRRRSSVSPLVIFEYPLRLQRLRKG